MKQFILVIAFLSNYSSNFIDAQNPNFAPVGAYWRYNFDDGRGPGYAILKVVSDTVVGGKTYRNLYLYANNYLGGTGPYITYTHFGMLDLRNDSVFQISRQGNVRFLYSFKQAVGDTIFYLKTATQQEYVVADSVKTENILGENRRVVYFTKHCKRQNLLKANRAIRLVENVGLLDDMMDWGEFFCGILGTRSYTPTCYNSGTAIYPPNPSNCSPISAINERIDTQISLFPNPANTDLTINFPSELTLNSVELMNYLGQIMWIKKGENLQKINVSNLPNGAYFVRLLFDNQSVTKKIRIQH
jgi:Secretion system C-terminal sorting domain